MYLTVKAVNGLRVPIANGYSTTPWEVASTLRDQNKIHP
jgi:hypothetical protein